MRLTKDMAKEKVGTKGTVHPDKEYSIDAFGTSILHLSRRCKAMVWLMQEFTGTLYDVSKDQLTEGMGKQTGQIHDIFCRKESRCLEKTTTAYFLTT